MNLFKIKKKTKSQPEESRNPETNRRKYNIVRLIPFALIFIFGGWLFLPKNLKHTESPFAKSDLAGAVSESQFRDNFSNIKLEAGAAYVFDVLNNRSLFEFNSDSQLPLASLTKIMTAIVAVENFPSYLLVSIPQEAILMDGDSGFLTGEKWLVNDLAEAMLISSSNDAAYAFSLEFKNDFGKDFVSLMNEKAQFLNLKQTYFLNPTGLDISKNTAGAYGSAKDVANLILYAEENHGALMEVTQMAAINIQSRVFKNTDLIVNEIPGLIAGKTGFSDLAGGNLAIIADKGYGHPIIIVVLGSTFDGRFNDVKTLYNLIP